MVVNDLVNAIIGKISESMYLSCCLCVQVPLTTILYSSRLFFVDSPLVFVLLPPLPDVQLFTLSRSHDIYPLVTCLKPFTSNNMSRIAYSPPGPRIVQSGVIDRAG